MRHPNLLLITVDCLRPDALGCCGGPARTPNVDSLAAGGIRYRNAFAHAHFTRPGFVALFSGAYPWRHGGSQRYTSERPSFVEALQAGGYQTLAVNSNAWLTPELGFGRGFAVYRDLAQGRPFAHRRPVVFLNHLLSRVGGGLAYPPYPTGERVTTAALQLLKEAQPPFFLWLHYMDTHWPYDLPGPRLYGPWDRRNRVYNARLARRSREDPARVAPAERQALLERYYRAVERVDREIGRLLDRAGEQAAVILTADHGEAFGEHGRYFHGPGLYVENLHVPIIVRGAGIPPGKVEEGIVRHVDIAPSLLELAGFEPRLPVDGASLIPAARRTESLAGLEAVSSIEDPAGRQRWIGLRDADWTALGLYEREAHGPTQAELYDRRADPGEKLNLAGRFPDRLGDLLKRALGYFDPAEFWGGGSHPAGLDEQLAGRLKALGYLE